MLMPASCGSARTRGEYDPLRLHGLDIGDLELVVAANLNLGAEFPEILNQVVGERIVVVENEDHENLRPACTGLHMHGSRASCQLKRHPSSQGHFAHRCAMIVP